MSRAEHWRLSPLVEFIREYEGRDLVRHGLFHRLTGEAFYISPQLSQIFSYLRQNSMTQEDLRLLRTDPQAEQTIDRLKLGNFLVCSLDPESLLQPFINTRLVLPAMNPAVTLRKPDGATIAVRLKDSHICRLPRDETSPLLAEEPVPEGAARLLRCAQRGSVLAEAVSTGRKEAGESFRELCSALEFLTDPARQLIRVKSADSGPQVRQEAVHYLIQNLVRERPRRESSEQPAEAKTFYEEEVADIDWNFDWVEPTVCHSFRYPTRAMGMQIYGERFCDAVFETLGASLNGIKSIDVLEVGGGTGSFARAFLQQSQRYQERFGQIRYTVLDCSPAMIQRQQRALAGITTPVRHIQQDAHTFSIPGEQFNIVISNEMIADLRVARRRTGDSAQTGPSTGEWYNAGVFSFLDRLKGHLAPGGTAFVTEYGGIAEPVTLVEHLNHPEYSIEFGSVIKHSEQAGFRSRLRSLSEFLDVFGTTEMLCGQQEHSLCLDRALSRLGKQMPYAAFCREGFERMFGDAVESLKIEGVQFAPLTEGLHFGPDLRQFQVLILSRPS